MKTFFNTISIKTNNYSSENVVVGLLAVSAGKIFYGFSKEKLKLANKMVKEEKIETFAKQVLEQINSTVENANEKFTTIQHKLEYGNTIFNEAYFSYLNKYSNGLIQFSESQFVNFEFDESKFSQYYSNFIGTNKTSKKENKKVSLHQKLKPYFNKEGLGKKADLNYTLDPQKFKGIVKDVQIPLITKNGSIKMIQEIDFTTGLSTITNHIYETKMIHESLKKFSEKIGCHFDKVNIAFEEPDIKAEQYQVFDLAYKEYKNSFNFVYPEEVNQLTDEILNTSSYQKFSKLVN